MDKCIIRINWLLLLFLFSSLLVGKGLCAQESKNKQAYIDSLLQHISEASDKEKTDIYFILLASENKRFADRQQVARQATELAVGLNNKELEAYVCLQSSLELINGGMHQIATKKLQTAYDYYASQPIGNLLVTTLILQGYNQHRQLFFTGALKYYLKALPLAKEINDLKRINNLYNRIANIYVARKDYKRAIHYARFVLNNCEEATNDCPFYLTILESLGDIYLKLGQLDTARYFIQLYFNKATKKTVENNVQIGYNRMADLKIAEGKMDEALLFADTALALAVKLNRKRGVVASHAQLATIYGRKSNSEKQVFHLSQQEVLSNQYGFLFSSKEALDKLWAIYEEKGDFKNADKFAQKWRIVSDSLSEVERINLLKRQDELLAQHEQQEKLQALEKEAISRNNRSRLLGIFTLFLLTILGLTFYFLRQRYHLSTSLQQKNKLLNAIVEERNILLKEIHHRVKNNLQIISSLLNLQMRHVQNKEAREALAEGRNRVRSIALIHQNLYQGMNFKEIKAKQYIDSLLNNIQSTFRNQLVELDSKVEDIFLEEETMTQVGLIVNEAVTNAYKHAFTINKKGKILLEIRKEGNILLVQIQDNGIGLPPAIDVANNQSLGLQLIQDFATRLKAGYILKSKNPGTIVQLKIPLKS